SALVLCLVLLSATCIVASAATAIKTDEKGSITICTYESKKDNNDEALDLGVKGAATGEEMEIPTGYIALEGVVYQLCSADGTAISGKTATTDANGVATFADLEQGTYVVKATTIPKNVTTSIADMKVTIPMTNPDGDGFIYDVKVYPKVDSVYGDVTFTKYAADGETPLQGATFKLQKKSNGSYADYKTGLVTNAEGQFTVKDLPAGDYQFIETDAPDGYILDSTPKQFSVPGDSSTYTYENGKYVYELDMMNSGDLTISKEADKDTAAIGDEVVWTITSSIPFDIDTYKKYEIIDELDAALEYVSAEVDGLTSGTHYKVTTDGQKVTVALTADGMAALKDKSSLVVKITTKVNADIDLYTGVDNTAQLKYTNKSNTVGTASGKDTIKTNGFQIKKVDSENDTVLEGATFELYDAQDNKVTFYTEDLKTTQTEITTGENGIAGFYGIANGTYYLVETKAPTGYELIGEKVEIVVEDGDYTSDIDKIIENVKSSTIINLPQTGGIGVEIVVIAGVLMMIAAAFVIRRKRVNG
ncbi:MAG: SpaH/EbpB family LPXTG-anchored major pilin, partial [Clostridia bacterium]|nr:SpaH/EbpB family LPXTG-anchored major pilin [Clostridia bacterium]